MKLLVVGTSHRLAPVEVRERVALDGEGEAALAHRLGAWGVQGLISRRFEQLAMELA